MRFSAHSIMSRLILTYCIIVVPLLAAVLAVNAYLRGIDAQNTITAVETFSQQVEANLETRVRICQNALSTLANNSDVAAFALYGSTSSQNLTDAYIYTTILTDMKKLVSTVKVQTDVYRVMLRFGSSRLPDVRNLMCYDADIAGGAWADRFVQWKKEGFLYGADTYLRYQDVPDQSVTAGSAYYPALCLYKPVYTERRDRLVAICEINILLSDLLSGLTSQEYEGVYEHMALVVDDPDGKTVLFSTSNVPTACIHDPDLTLTDNTSVNIDGTRYQVSVHPCACVAADLIILVPDSTLASPTSGRLLLLTILAPAVLSILILSFILSRFVLRGLRELSAVIGRFGNGEGDKSLTMRVRMDQMARSRSSDEVRDIALRFNEMAERIENLIRDVEYAHNAEKSAIYNTLAAQIHPHFICNALDMLRLRAVRASDTVLSRSITRLMTYFRYNSSAGMRVSLADELENLRDYIDIVNQIRSDEASPDGIRLVVRVDSRNNPSDCAVLKFILQPLAENAVKHAFPDGGAGHIFVDIVDEPDGRIKVTVSDDGVGMSRDRLNEVRASLFTQEQSDKVGLQNIARRMVYSYTKDAFELRSVEGFGTLVTLVFPFEDLNG